MKKTKWLPLVASVFLLTPVTAEAGSFGKDDPSGVPGQWYIGTSPSAEDPAKHPVLFVHGLNSSSNTWWNNNNMYDTAYVNGYETAFIDLYPTKNMWDNGALLAQKVRDMYHHFGEKVVVVAHSKGGIDTQSAIVHNGASPYIARVITLSTPHYGSQLADLAYSNGASWLASIIGSKNDATYSLQTGYMSYYRSQTDNRPERSSVPFYTFGGTSWGGFGGSLYWGGLYLSSYGQNDGAVTVTSSRLPYATELRVGKWDHGNIKTGTSTFNLFKSYLNEQVFAASLKVASVASLPQEELLQATTYIAGGERNKVSKETIVVEEGVSELTIDWMSNQSDSTLTLISPSGTKTNPFKANVDETEIFEGAYHYTTTLTLPESGEWKVETKGDQKEAYLLHTQFTSDLNELVTIDLTNRKVAVKSKDTKLKYKTTVHANVYEDGKLKQKKVNFKVNQDGTYSVPALGSGVYNVTIELDGKYNGTEFKRSVVKSFYVDNTGVVYLD
ncbi:esterase/lipase family protein [Mangrovibacillus cuniculi]|uniref:esterase/lipase family protein n=1 Tax=Mangrovibacillus cuniculi TaxID=2593652 RepID=UPI001EFA1212|nr:hypothetical protein [Mangrovibacillus cuniculi]